MSGYNGWKNYETWNVKLWMDNDQSEYERWREMTVEVWNQSEAGKSYATQTRLQAATYNLSELLKDEYEDASQDILQAASATTSVWADLLGAALSEVDWYEIAGHMLEEADFTEEAV